MKPASTTRRGAKRCISSAERSVEGFAACEGAVLHHTRRNAARGRELEPLGVGAVGDDGAHREAGVEQRLQVAAAPGDQRDDQAPRRPIIASGRTQRSKSSPET